MEFPEKSKSGDDHENVSTQTCDNQADSGENKEVCGLCGKRGLSESDEIPVGGNLPDNVCQCFFFREGDPPEASFTFEQESESPIIQACDSQNVNRLPVIEVSCVEESSNISMKDYVNSGEESNVPEFSPSSNGLDKLSPDRNSADQRSIISPRSGEYFKTSPNTERGNISSGYALSLYEQSPDPINFTSPSSGADSKNSSNKETSPSSGYAMSLGEQSFDRNFTDHRNITTSPSSGEDSNNSLNREKESNCARDLVKINTDSKYKTEYRSSQSSPSEQGHRNVKQLRAGESSKSEYMVKYASNTDSKQTMKSEYRDSQSYSSNQRRRNIQQLRVKQFGNYESMGSDAANKTRQYARGTYTGGEFRFDNPNIRFTSYRPLLPRPFPTHQSQPHQPYMNPSMNIPVPTPYTILYPQQCPQPFNSYSNSATNMPIIRANVPERFAVTQCPQAGTSYQHPNSEGNGNLSKRSLAEAGKLDSVNNTEKDDWIKSWAEGVHPGCAPPDYLPPDESSLPQWSKAENEENEGKAPEWDSSCPGLPETSPDERSSTEKSEEENRRQRSLRRPPRYNKKGRPK